MLKWYHLSLGRIGPWSDSRCSDQFMKDCLSSDRRKFYVELAIQKGMTKNDIELVKRKDFDPSIFVLTWPQKRYDYRGNLVVTRD